jgi:hypothetical protein
MLSLLRVNRYCRSSDLTSLSSLSSFLLCPFSLAWFLFHYMYVYTYILVWWSWMIHSHLYVVTHIVIHSDTSFKLRSDTWHHP